MQGTGGPTIQNEGLSSHWREQGPDPDDRDDHPDEDQHDRSSMKTEKTNKPVVPTIFSDGYKNSLPDGFSGRLIAASSPIHAVNSV